jgi:hypothetical protein
VFVGLDIHQRYLLGFIGSGGILYEVRGVSVGRRRRPVSEKYVDLNRSMIGDWAQAMWKLAAKAQRMFWSV